MTPTPRKLRPWQRKLSKALRRPPSTALVRPDLSALASFMLAVLRTNPWPPWLPSSAGYTSNLQETIEFFNSLLLNSPDPYTDHFTVPAAAWFKLTDAELDIVRNAYLAKGFVCAPIEDHSFRMKLLCPECAGLTQVSPCSICGQPHFPPGDLHD